MPEPLLVLATPTACEWFLLCDNTTTRAAKHPILGQVPVCDRCARHVGLIDTSKVG